MLRRKNIQDTRVGAIATGLAPSGEIVIFRATESPSESDVIGRIRLGANEEADDIDFASLEEGETPGRFRLAYTNGVDVWVGDISSTTRSNAAPDLSRVMTIPLPSSGARAARPKFRSLRFLSPTHLLVLQNAPPSAAVASLSSSSYPQKGTPWQRSCAGASSPEA